MIYGLEVIQMVAFARGGGEIKKGKRRQVSVVVNLAEKFGYKQNTYKKYEPKF